MVDINDILDEIPEEEILKFLRTKKENEKTVDDVPNLPNLVKRGEINLVGVINRGCPMCAKPQDIDWLRTIEGFPFKLRKDQFDKLVQFLGLDEMIEEGGEK